MSVDMQRYVLQIICAIPFGVFLGVLAILFEVLPIANHKRYKIESIEQKVYAHFHLQLNPAKPEKTKFKYILRFVLDIIFWLIISLLTAVFSFATNDGILRWFSIVFIILSAFATWKLLGFYLYFLKKILFIFLKILCIFVFLIPRKWFLKTSKQILTTLKKYVKKLC